MCRRYHGSRVLAPGHWLAAAATVIVVVRHGAELDGNHDRAVARKRFQGD